MLDPTDIRRPVVGLNPLAAEGRSPELVADQMLGLLHALYASSWGPRTSDILSCALLTLCRSPGSTLISLPLLLTDASFRRRVTRHVDDPVVLGPFWAQYEAWSDAERSAAIAPSLNKLRPLLRRPELRGVFGQPSPRFQVREVFTKRRILLVNLAKGQLGPESSALVGACVISAVWNAVLARSQIEPSRRHEAYIYVDEFQDYLKLPVDFADALAQGRGLGVGLVLAHQYFAQLDPSTLAGVINNAQSRVAFRLSHKEATTLASPGGPAAEDFEGLSAFEAYAQLVVAGTVQRWLSLRTRPMPAVGSDGDDLRWRSAAAYGVDREELERAIRELVEGASNAPGADDIGRRRRTGGAQ